MRIEYYRHNISIYSIFISLFYLLWSSIFSLERTQEFLFILVSNNNELVNWSIRTFEIYSSITSLLVQHSTNGGMVPVDTKMQVIFGESSWVIIEYKREIKLDVLSGLSSVYHSISSCKHSVSDNKIFHILLCLLFHPIHWYKDLS